MTTGYGINGIGYSPLGNLGLGSTGTFASYDYCMPSSMGMYGMGNMGAVPGMYGMYNYMNPEQMTQMGQRIETSQLAHASSMHGNVKTMQVTNQLQSTDAVAAGMINDGGLLLKVSEMKSKINNGDLHGAVGIYKELKELVYNRFKDELASRGDEISVQVELRNIIDNYYYDTNGTQLRADIEQCGESGYKNGFRQIWEKGHSKLTIKQALHQIYGDRIDGAANEKTEQVIGKAGGLVASAVEGAGYGGLAAGVAGTLLNVGSLLLTGRTALNWSTVWKGACKFSVLGAVGNTAWKFI